MKKNFLRILAIAAIAMFAGYNVYWSELKIEGMSELALKNVEALAIGESSQSIYCPYPGKGCIIKYTNGTYETIPNHWANPR